MKRADLWIGGASGLAAASWLGWTPYSLTETLGFVTGAACVYLVVKENVWNFPIGIANSLLFLVLFAGARLYGDAALQVVYVALGFQGWYLWLRGGENRTALSVERAPCRVLAGVAVFEASGAGRRVHRRTARGAARKLTRLRRRPWLSMRRFS